MIIECTVKDLSLLNFQKKKKKWENLKYQKYIFSTKFKLFETQSISYSKVNFGKWI